MLKTDLQRIVRIMCRRAQRQGSVSPQEVRDVLARAGLPEEQWLEVVSLAGNMLSNHDGRLYYSGPTPAVQREQRRQRRLNRALRRLIRGYKAAVLDERRRQGRFDFVHPVQVETEEGRTFTLLSCDLSSSGIRLVAPFSLLGKKIRVTLPCTTGPVQRRFVVRILWSSLLGDGLYENGATFLSVAAEDAPASPALPTTPHVSTAFAGPVLPAPSQGELPMPAGAFRHLRPR